MYAQSGSYVACGLAEDYANQLGVAEVRRADEDGVRTIGVCTKVRTTLRAC